MANIPTGQRDDSRSPARNELSYDDHPDGDRQRDAVRYGRDRKDFRGSRSRDRYDGDRDRDDRSEQNHYRGHDSRRDYRYGDEHHSADYRGREDRHRGERSYSRPRHSDIGRDDDPRDRRSDSRYSPDGQSRHTRSASPARNAGAPTDTIILEGLPKDVSTDDVRESLTRHYGSSRCPSFDVRVPLGRGRRAFVQYDQLNDAVDFIQDNYPRLLLDFAGLVDGDASGKTPVYIHYARNREDPGSWTCTVCDFSNFATRTRCKSCGALQTDTSMFRPTLTGESDASDTPSQILVFFPLAASVTEEVLAAGVAKLQLEEKPAAPKKPGDGAPKLKSTAPTGDTTGYGAKPGSLHRVFLMRDRDTNESFKFGFAEFWTVDDALAAVTKFKKYREFTIASAAVNVSTIHLGVFIPEQREITPAIEKLSFAPLFNPTIRVKYWDPHAFPSQNIVTENSPERAQLEKSEKLAKGSEDQAAELKKAKKRKAEGSGPPASGKRPAPMIGQMALWQKKHDELHVGKKSSETATGESDNALATSGDRVPVKISLSGSNASQQGSVKSSVAIAAPKSAVPVAAAAQSISPAPAQDVPAHSSGTAARATTQSPNPGETPAVSYVDREKVCCLICMMKYKNLDDLGTHEKSRNHKMATADEEKVKAALPRLAARDKRMQKAAAATGTGTGTGTQENSGPTSQYRDRAKERREVFNQPAKPTAAPTGKQTSSSSAAREPSEPSGPSPATTAAAAAAATTAATTAAAVAAAPPPSKGSAMLAKMGWTSGKGLGANGEGRTEVIATHAYQEGVGLGAEGGKLGDAAELAQRNTTNSYADYLTVAQQKARERYNKMS
ncbi:hypothetical protein SODALDRAFT_64687 [Sodiomyces alkalinus F11]|uniref:RNA-binding protein n=1 Tax=Sodiomyces alkalinus (strain CBS 110278 / VKM F-3762 / F11) TaxID=1314773 RepID=A0A3N2PLI9_SODAK|nr:hypothetical protein SODALDRAFT_64687 [Sodiomyces alkalinus F11]ROT35388.1 hypothetical protein SODALDRAFT_64687 [Sodiomyces alkalinus F11]